MDGKPLAVSVPCTGRKCQYLVTGLRLYSCINRSIDSLSRNRHPYIFQAPEHASVIHIVTVDNVVIIRKIRFVKAFQKDTLCDVAVAMQVGSQIFLIVTWIQNWIVDAKFILIIKPYPSDNIWIFSFQFVKFYFYICSPPVFFLLSYCLLPIMSGSAWTSMKVVLLAGW